MFDKRIGQVKCSPSYGSTILHSPPTLVQSTCSPVKNNKQMLNKCWVYFFLILIEVLDLKQSQEGDTEISQIPTSHTIT